MVNVRDRVQVVVVGAGIVGTSAAYHLAELGVTDVLVVDQGPLYETGGVHLARAGPGVPDGRLEDHVSVNPVHGEGIAYCYVPTRLAVEGTLMDVEYFGRRVPATVTAEPLFDPRGERMKA